MHDDADNLTEWAAVAWAGWTLRVPRDWRPLRVEGDHRAGRVFLGADSVPTMQVQWARLGGRWFSPQRWVRRRLRREPKGTRAGGDGRGVRGFGHWGSAESDRPGGVRRARWVGYAPELRLGVDVLLGICPGSLPCNGVGILASLRAASAEADCRWAMSDASFISPPGYRLESYRLNLGDVMLRLRGEGDRGLVLRQVYPAGLALQRRPLDWWLNDRGDTRLRYTQTGEDERWSVRSFGCVLPGSLRRGRRHLPAPLGRLRPRSVMTVAVTDTRLDRLLLATVEGRTQPDPALLSRSVGGMNWSRLEKSAP